MGFIKKAAVEYSTTLDDAPASYNGYPLTGKTVSKKTGEWVSKENWQKLDKFMTDNGLDELREPSEHQCQECKDWMSWYININSRQDGDPIRLNSGHFSFNNRHNGACTMTGQSEKVLKGRKIGLYCCSGYCNCLLSKKKAKYFVPFRPDDPENLARYCSMECKEKHDGEAEQVCHSLNYSTLYPLYHYSYYIY